LPWRQLRDEPQGSELKDRMADLQNRKDALLKPDEGQLRFELRGNLAAMLTVAQQTKRSPETGDLVVPVQMVAGACNRRYLPLWSGAA
jgi:hypothetical protein